MKTNLLFATMFTATMFTASVAMAQVMIPDGTKIRVRLEENLTSETAELGQTVDFAVTQEVRVGDAIAIANGARATGSIIRTEGRRMLTRGGELDFTIERVQMVDGNWLSVRYHPMRNRGRNGAAAGVLTAGIAAVFFRPGHDATIIKGRTYDVFADESTYVAAAVAASAPLVTRVLPQAPIMVVRQANGGAANNGGLPPSVNTAGNPVLMNNTSVMNTAATQSAMAMGMGNESGAAAVSINANQPGADIEVDGMFVGNAPATIQLTPGVHQVVLKHGGSVWQRNIQVTGGAVTINATLGARGVQRASR
jgi:hypothetical protein